MEGKLDKRLKIKMLFDLWITVILFTENGLGWMSKDPRLSTQGWLRPSLKRKRLLLWYWCKYDRMSNHLSHKKDVL